MVTFLAMVVFGGLGHIWGGIIGAIIITIVYDLTRPLYEYQLFIFWINNSIYNSIYAQRHWRIY